jgi:hypothetical protein
MDVFVRVKNVADSKKEIALLLAGKNKQANKLAIGFGTFQGPVSNGGQQQGSSKRRRAPTCRRAS